MNAQPKISSLSLGKSVLAFLCIWVVLTATSIRFSFLIVAFITPIMTFEMSLLAPRYELISLNINDNGLVSSLKASVITRKAQKHAERIFPAGIPMESSILVSHLLQPYLLFFSMITTALIMKWRRLRDIIVPSIIACIVLTICDIPIVLIAAIDDIVLNFIFVSHHKRSILTLWMECLDGGGRLVLGISTGLFVLSMTRGFAHSSLQR